MTWMDGLDHSEHSQLVFISDTKMFIYIHTVPMVPNFPLPPSSIIWLLKSISFVLHMTLCFDAYQVSLSFGSCADLESPTTGVWLNSHWWHSHRHILWLADPIKAIMVLYLITAGRLLTSYRFIRRTKLRYRLNAFFALAFIVHTRIYES